MKILQINNFYNYGSTGKIVHDIHTALLERGHESIVCYGRGAGEDGKLIRKVCSEVASKWNNVLSRFTGIMYGGFRRSTEGLKRMILKEQPDVVHLQCLNCFFINIYELVSWLKENHIKAVLTLHAEFMYTANCGHALDCDRWHKGCGNCPRLKKETRSLFLDRTAVSFQKMEAAFRGYEKDLILASVSPWLVKRSKQSPILKAFRNEVVYNGIDTEVFSPRDCSYLIQRHGLEGKKVILHTSAKFTSDPAHLKGGYYVIEIAKKMPDVVFLVAGKNEAVGELPNNVILLGQITDQKELADYYTLADGFLLTSKRETFSMPCAESLCCGTPVFGFEAGGPEMISLRDYSSFVPHGDIDGLAGKIRKYFDGPASLKSKISECAIPVYSKESMVNKYIEIYSQLSACDELS